MPATYAHHIFTKDVMKNLNNSVQSKIKKEENIFNMFGKSFDIFYFVKSDLGYYAHTHNANLYFTNIIRYIKENNLQNNSQVLAYLYGSICHYILDSTIHPYVYYKTGKYNPKDLKTKKYKGQHSYLEYMIDAILYDEKNRKPIFKANLAKEMFSKIKFSDELKNTIDYACYDTFNSLNTAKYFFRGYRNFRFAMAHIMQSYFGIKIFFYKLLDKLNIFKKKTISYLCYHIRKLDHNVLNKEHKLWCYPTDKKISYHYSFYDLYDIALIKAIKIINDLDEALNKDEKELKKVLKSIGNLSYLTGKNCDNKGKMRYFEY